jgi:hypothetical protein
MKVLPVLLIVVPIACVVLVYYLGRIQQTKLKTLMAGLKAQADALEAFVPGEILWIEEALHQDMVGIYRRAYATPMPKARAFGEIKQ